MPAFHHRCPLSTFKKTTLKGYVQSPMSRGVPKLGVTCWDILTHMMTSHALKRELWGYPFYPIVLRVAGGHGVASSRNPKTQYRVGKPKLRRIKITLSRFILCRLCILSAGGMDGQGREEALRGEVTNTVTSLCGKKILKSAVSLTSGHISPTRADL